MFMNMKRTTVQSMLWMYEYEVTWNFIFRLKKNMLNSNVMLILRPVKKIDVLFGTPHMRCLVTVHLMI